MQVSDSGRRVAECWARGRQHRPTRPSEGDRSELPGVRLGGVFEVGASPRLSRPAQTWARSRRGTAAPHGPERACTTPATARADAVQAEDTSRPTDGRSGSHRRSTSEGVDTNRKAKPVEPPDTDVPLGDGGPPSVQLSSPSVWFVVGDDRMTSAWSSRAWISFGCRRHLTAHTRPVERVGTSSSPRDARRRESWSPCVSPTVRPEALAASAFGRTAASLQRPARSPTAASAQAATPVMSRPHTPPQTGLHTAPAQQPAGSSRPRDERAAHSR
jgi:hypothetical protein